MFQVLVSLLRPVTASNRRSPMQVDSFLMTTSILDLDIHALQLLNGMVKEMGFNEIHERNDFIKKNLCIT